MTSIATELGALGFQSFGDLVCERFGEIVIRGFVSNDADRYAVYMHGTFGQRVVEFVTRFDDGTWTTTTGNDGIATMEDRGLYGQAHPEFAMDIASLFGVHTAAIEKAQVDRGAQPESHEGTCEALAASIDAYLERQLGE